MTLTPTIADEQSSSPRPVFVTCLLNDPLGDWVLDTVEQTNLGETEGFAPNEIVDQVTECVDTRPLVLLPQSRPGSLPQDLPTQLREANERVELLSIAGSWCEGELRTGSPWPDVDRVYWHELPAWLANRGELPPEREKLSTAIDSPDYDTAAALIAALSRENIDGIWFPRFGARPLCAPPSTALWVGGQLNGLQASRLAEFTAEMKRRSTPVVAVLDFPRLDEVNLAQAIGVAAVLGKPWRVETVAQALRQAVAEPATEVGAFSVPDVARTAA